MDNIYAWFDRLGCLHLGSGYPSGARERATSGEGFFQDSQDIEAAIRVLDLTPAEHEDLQAGWVVTKDFEAVVAALRREYRNEARKLARALQAGVQNG